MVYSILMLKNTLSITCFNTYPGPRTCIVNLLADGTTRRNLFKQNVPQDATFVWNDRIVLTGTDELWVFSDGNVSHWWVSYIDQDWTGSN